MEYLKTLQPGYNIHTIKTDKFKTTTIKINFKRKLLKEEITARNMLVNTLCQSTKDYPTKRLFEIRIEELYKLGFKATSYISGSYSVISFDATYLNQKYINEDMLEKTLQFLKSVLFNPNVVDNHFETKGFDAAKRFLEESIDSLKENTKRYSITRMLENMEDSLISVRNIGYKEDIKTIDEYNLYEYYQSVISNDIVDIFVIGNIDVDKTVEAINDNFNFHSNLSAQDSHFISPKSFDGKVKEIKETQHINQSNLVMGFKIDPLSDFELRYVLPAYSFILGGSPDSKLFSTVREKNSLCYSISSIPQQLINILTVWAGINAKDFEKARDLIIEEVKSIVNGEFSNEDLDKAKTTYINSIQELTDNPISILNLYVGIEYLKSDDLDTRIKMIKQVTIQNVLDIAKKIHLDTIYLLEGDLDEEA